ncbi:MAG: PQQ-binding-like beta-propeller repeat protein, partial [Planctomycetaceae bacterium]|nr:PQQ-binding-like beta-propeller repeat protein [Planctomycetaceae bacterium]
QYPIWGHTFMRDTLIGMGIILFTFCACLAGEESASPERWPGFLGIGATAIDPATLPLEWSPTSNVSWQTELVGTGQSSPLIWGDKVFVTSIDGNMKEDCHVTALSLADGSRLWDHKMESAQPVRSNYFQSRSAPTPAVDGERVYAFFETGKLVALSHDGKELWVRNLVDEFGEFEVRIGMASSLAQTADSVFVLVDHEGPSYLLAVDKATGETKWQTERFSRQSYASPIVLDICGQPQVVVSSEGSVDGYDPATGDQLWTMEGVGGNRSTTPLPFGDSRFLISASPGMHDEQLDEAKESNFAMQVVKTDDGFETKVLWKVAKAMPSFGSPMVHQGLAYWVNNVGVLYCFNAETGETVYTKRSGQLCWATPLGLGDHVYLFGKDGLTTVIAAGPDFKVITKNELIEGATEVGEADVRRRETQGHQHRGSSATDSTETKSEGEQPAEGATQEQPVRRGGRPGSDAADGGDSRGKAEEVATANEGRSGGRGGRPGRPSGGADGGSGSGDSQEEGGAPRTRDGRTFADPVQYGYAAVNGSLIIRTGGKVFCLRNATTAPVGIKAVKVSAADTASDEGGNK